MEEELKNRIQELRYYSDDYHKEGVEFKNVNERLSQYFFGKSEGIDWAIEVMRDLLSESN